MPTTTSNYSLLKPLVNNATDQDLWGGYLNDDMDSIDTLLRSGIAIATQSSQTTGFTAVATISTKRLYPCDATSAGFTATIPAASASGNGATVFIKKTDATANIVTIGRTGADTLDGATSLTCPAQNDCYGLVSDGVSKWSSICRPSVMVPDASTTVKGIIEIATDAEALAGTDTVRAITSAGLASGKNLASKGHYTLPGGFIVQWGFQDNSGAFSPVQQNITFDITFPTICYGVLITVGESTAINYNSDYGAVKRGSISTTGFSGIFTCDKYWWAWGK